MNEDQVREAAIAAGIPADALTPEMLEALMRQWGFGATQTAHERMRSVSPRQPYGVPNALGSALGGFADGYGAMRNVKDARGAQDDLGRLGQMLMGGGGGNGNKSAALVESLRGSPGAETYGIEPQASYPMPEDIMYRRSLMR